MLRKDEGVVLAAVRRGETSKVVTFLGRDSGKVRLMAKGALGERSSFRGSLEPGNVIEVVYYYKEGRSQYYLKEVHVYSAIRSDRASLARVAASLAVLELVDQVCYWHRADAAIVDLVISFLMSDDALDPLTFFLAFELKLLDALGALPDFLACAECGAASRYYHPSDGESRCRRHLRTDPHRVALGPNLQAVLAELTTQPLASFTARDTDADTRKRLGKILHWTYTFHIDGYALPEALKLIPKREES